MLMSGEMYANTSNNRNRNNQSQLDQNRGKFSQMGHSSTKSARPNSQIVKDLNTYSSQIEKIEQERSTLEKEMKELEKHLQIHSLERMEKLDANYRQTPKRSASR